MEEAREIAFAPIFTEMNDNCVLMELPEAVLEALRSGREVTLKGQGDEEAIVCTDSQSFLLRSHETSNSLLVLDEDCVLMNAHQVLISEKVTPPLHKLHRLLTEAAFTWSEESPAPLHTFADLRVRVQASDAEIRTELQALHAFEWRGYWRVMEDQERIETIKHVLCLMMRGHLGTVSIPTVLEKIRAFERVPLLACLQSAGKVEADMWLPDPPLLYRMCATDLLLSKRDYFEDEFRAAFRHLSDMLIPAKLATEVRLDDVLSGVAIRKSLKGRNVLRYFPAETLVKDFNGRLEQLFAEKEKWSLEEMKPYVGDVSDKELQQLLLRFARRVVEDSTPYYLKKA